VYTIIDRRTINQERLPETTERAEREYFPKLQAAPGFSGFYLVADEGSDLFVGITVWESKSAADAFEASMSGWLQVLEELGHNGQTANRGEAVIELQPQR
jgi:heme-degrading monooxygenase HmoA